MMGLSIPHLLLLLLVILVVFGAGKLPKVMGDLGKGIRHFREGLKGESTDAANTKLPDGTKDVPKDS
jgi:sec-independent protein translocase protein TatA